jgi:branched-subunit amino acid aminotransferase/4-amino-4-deoxychorismate lyase
MGQKRESVELFESLLWTPDDGYYLLGRHVARLLRGADYFDVSVAETAVFDTLSEFSTKLTEPSKVRVVVNSEQCTVNSVPLTEGAGQLKEPIRVGLATDAVRSDNVYLYHKTTRRQMYTQALASRPDCDDVILWNEHGEVTEASSSNIVVEMGGERLTPPVSCGLLAGTFREELLENGNLHEKVIMKDELLLTDAIFLINSVRCWRKTQFIDK